MSEYELQLKHEAGLREKAVDMLNEGLSFATVIDSFQEISLQLEMSEQLQDMEMQVAAGHVH